MSDELLRQAFARIRGKLEGAMRTAGKMAQAEIEQSISTPVGRDFAGNVVVRSLPGRPPRMETGQLAGNVESAVYSRPNAVGFAVGSSRPETPDVPADLEFGISLEARPYMRPAFDRWKISGAGIIKQILA